MKMRNTSVLLLLLFTAFAADAQVSSLLLMSEDSIWKSKSMMAFMSGDASIASNAVDVDFMQKSLLGGFIPRAHTEALLSNMPERSRAGFAANAQLDLLNFRDTLFGRGNLGLRATLSTNYQGFIGFRPTLFETVYIGNGNAAGTTTDLGPIAMQTQSWQKFGFGLFSKKTLSGITLSLVEGQSIRSMAIDRAAFTTAAQGDTLALQLEGDYFRSDTARVGWANGSGIGACIDFDYNMKLDDDKALVSVSVRNLGFVAWNSRSEAYRVNSSVDWVGLNVTDWLDAGSDSIGLPSWSDSLQAKRTQATRIKTLPASIQFRYLRKWNGMHYWETGFGFTPNSASVPLVYAGITHAISEHLWISERISYGGYGGFAIGAEVQWLSSKAWFVRAGASQLDGWILSTAGGRSLYVNLGKNF